MTATQPGDSDAVTIGSSPGGRHSVGLGVGRSTSEFRTGTVGSAADTTTSSGSSATIYLRSDTGDSLTAALLPAPNNTCEPIDELEFPNTDPNDPVTRRTIVRFVTFLSATDPLSAGESSELHAAYDTAYESHRNAWLADAYRSTRETFEERFGDTPAAFTDAFSDSSADAEEVLWRLVGSGGFTDRPEPAFAREVLGRDHEFPSFIDFVADNHGWSPPVPE